MNFNSVINFKNDFSNFTPINLNFFKLHHLNLVKSTAKLVKVALGMQ